MASRVFLSTTFSVTARACEMLPILFHPQAAIEASIAADWKLYFDRGYLIRFRASPQRKQGVRFPRSRHGMEFSESSPCFRCGLARCPILDREKYSNAVAARTMTPAVNFRTRGKGPSTHNRPIPLEITNFATESKKCSAQNRR